jgi:hypothetical protein
MSAAWAKNGHKTLGLGRLKAGVMNRTEAAYARHLEARKHAGEVVWYGFEKVTFKLASDVRFTPDFVALMADGQLICLEVKGTTTKTSSAGVKSKAPYFRDDARAKIRIAAELIPMAFVVVYLVAGEWVEEEVR